MKLVNDTGRLLEIVFSDGSGGNSETKNLSVNRN
jgi:hypothetical protein